MTQAKMACDIYKQSKGHIKQSQLCFKQDRTTFITLDPVKQAVNNKNRNSSTQCCYINCIIVLSVGVKSRKFMSQRL